MPSADEIARSVGRLYASVEREILTVISSHLGKGLDRPAWATEKRAEISAVRLAAEGIIGRLNRSRALEQAVGVAATQGDDDARAELDALGRRSTSDRLDAAAVNAMGRELAGQVRPRHVAILRGADDVYRQVIAQAAPLDVTGVLTRRDAAQRALWDFADRGVSSFTDRSGRRWDLASYAEMATRTASARAMVDSHVGRLVAEGIRLVQVSDSPQECPLCRPWEGKVLAADGSAGTVQVEHPIRDGEYISVEVEATLSDARSAGLLHPNCTHSVSAYTPGITRTPTDTANPTGYEARQRLRALERRVRRWQARKAGALDDTARARANAGLKAAQADLKAHVATTEAKRQPHRERLGTAR